MAIKCYISNVEYDITDKYQIREQAGQSSSSSIDVVPIGLSLPPVSWQAVILKENDVPFFYGIIQNVDTPTFSSKYDRFVYPLDVSSGECIFNNRLVSETFTGKYTHEIVDYLFTNYLLEEGLTKGTITPVTRYYESYTASRLTLSEVLKELGDAIGAVARVSANKVFSFITKGDFAYVDTPESISQIRKSETGQTLRTVQFVSGANTETSQQSRAGLWIDGQKEQLLAYQISELQGATINGTPVGIGLKGVDEEDVLKTFLWRYGENVISLNSNATTKPVAGDLVAFLYKGFYSVEIAEENEALKNEIALLSGLSGKIEAVEIDTTITNYADGKNKAFDLLDQNDDREETVSCNCEDLIASEILNVWTLSFPDIFIEGEYVVVERTITDRYDRKLINLKLKNRGFYSRYGTVLNKNDKKINDLAVRTNDVIIKRSSFKDSAITNDTFTMLDYGQVVFPTLSETEIFDTMILGDGAFPVPF